MTTWYRRTVTSGACSDISPAIQITVLPAIANNTVAAVQTICNGQTPAGIDRHTSDRRQWNLYVSLAKQHYIRSGRFCSSLRNEQYPKLYTSGAFTQYNMVQKNSDFRSVHRSTG